MFQNYKIERERKKKMEIKEIEITFCKLFKNKTNLQTQMKNFTEEVDEESRHMIINTQINLFLGKELENCKRELEIAHKFFQSTENKNNFLNFLKLINDPLVHVVESCKKIFSLFDDFDILCRDYGFMMKTAKKIKSFFGKIYEEKIQEVGKRKKKRIFDETNIKPLTIESLIYNCEWEIIIESVFEENKKNEENIKKLNEIIISKDQEMLVVQRELILVKEQNKQTIDSLTNQINELQKEIIEKNLTLDLYAKRICEMDEEIKVLRVDKTCEIAQKPKFYEQKDEIERKKIKKEQIIHLEDLITIKEIAKGAFGTLNLAKHKKIANQQLYAVKTTSTVKKDLEDLENENKIWGMIPMSNKPKALANFYSSTIEEIESQTNKIIHYHLIFDYYPKSIKKVIEELKDGKENLRKFPLKTLLKFTKDLICTLAFLQTFLVCHRDLKPDNLLVDEKCENIFVIDLGESKQLQSCKTTVFKEVVGTPCYLSPELYEIHKYEVDLKKINFFKSDAFAMGLVLLELGVLSLPKRNNDMKIYAQNIEKLIVKFEKNYHETANEENLLGELDNLMKILRICLMVDREKRFDFIQLFDFILKIDSSNNLSKIRETILVWDRDSEKVKEVCKIKEKEVGKMLSQKPKDLPKTYYY